MTGVKTNERPGTKAVLRHYHMSASKARQVLNLIRGESVDLAAEILNGTEREAARVISKVLASAVANAVHNDGQNSDDLYVAAAYADEGTTMKRWRPRARGRATKIRKRTCHITVIVDRLPEDRLERRLAARQAAGTQRSRRVAESQRRADQQQRGRRRDAAREAEIEAIDEEVGENEEEIESTVAVDETVVVETDIVEEADQDESVSEEADQEDAKPAKAAAKKTTKKATKATKKTTKKATASKDDDAESEEKGK
jgi:large subunit ribosomal protein L22